MAEAFCIAATSSCMGTLMVKPVDYLLELVKRPLRYLFCLNNIAEEFQERKENLIGELARVQADVERAKRHFDTQVIEKNVENWLTNAENVLEEARSLEQRIEENKRCFWWCPDWSWRYELGKNMEQKTQAIRKLVDSSEFKIYGHRAPHSKKFLKSKDLIASESYTSAFNQIIEALRSDKVSMIGVWGMGGVGKTTLVTEVGSDVNQDFDRVIKVVVSQTPIIENIQNKILEKFFDDSDQIKQMDKEQKKNELRDKLERENKILIILDDLWEELNLKEIGIPLDGNRKGCKIILTTRRRQVCQDMDSQVTVPLGVLDEEEAWTLFKMKASLDSASPHSDIIDVARKVAKQCGGLPIAIVTLARALKSKDLNGWELALDKLQNSRLMDIENIPKQIEKNVYLSLEMSYNQLRETTKSCFLLCALYPEDYSIDVEDLVRYAWALRLYRHAGSIKLVRKEVFEAIKILKDSCLLSAVDDKKRFIKLHDVVRDVARWIASNENNGLLTKSGVENESSKQKLEILLEEYDSRTPNEAFEGMPELKVLSIRSRGSYYDHDNFFSLNALESLTNLRALHLEGFSQLKDISALAKLKKLEILSLHRSGLLESIDNSWNLDNLRVLDIYRCECQGGFLSNLINQRLLKVEELYLFDSTIKTGKASLPKINLLPTLASLFLQVSSQGFPENFVFPELERYKIGIGTHCRTDIDAISSKSLSFSRELPLNVVLKLLQNVEFLEVSSIEEKDIKCLTDTTPGNVPLATILQNLKGVIICSCNNLQVIFQMNKAKNHLVLLSKLQDLHLKELPDLEYIWKIPTQHVSLESLEAVKIDNCGKLKSLFSFSLARSLKCLKELEIDNCGELKQIVKELEGDEQKISPNMNTDKPLCLTKLRSLKITHCGSLEYIFPNFVVPEGQRDCLMLEGSQHFSLSSLKVVKIGSCKKLKSVFSASLIQQGLLLLEELKITNCDELKTLFIEQESDGETESNSHLHSLRLPSLTTLSINGCPRLEYVLPITLAQVISRLHLQGVPLSAFKYILPNRNALSLHLKDCKDLECLADSTVATSGMFTDLVELEMINVVGLKMLCNGDPPRGFVQKLEMLTVEECRDIVSLSPVAVAQNLKRLRVSDCEKLEEIFPIDKFICNKKSLLSNLESLKLRSVPELRWIVKGPTQHVSLRSLTDLDIYRCDKLESIFSSSIIPSLRLLETFYIRLCNKLETVFTEPESGDATESNTLCLPNLKTLEIIECPILKYVGPENFFIKAPALKDLQVGGCPQFSNFTIQQDNLLQYSKDFDECIDDAELCNNQLGERSPNVMNFEQPFQPPTGDNFVSTLERVELNDLIWLRDIWKGPIQVVVTNLTELKVYGCNGLTNVFPVMLVRNLPKLRILEVMWCEKLEQIIVKDDTLASSSQSHDEYETGVKNEKETSMFPLLRELRLKQLPSLVSFSPVGYHLVFSSLQSLKIKDCSRMITSFTLDDLTESLHAETKATRLDDASPSQPDICWERNFEIMKRWMERMMERLEREDSFPYVERSEVEEMTRMMPRFSDEGCSSNNIYFGKSMLRG